MDSDHIKVFKSYEERLDEYKYILLMFSPTSISPSSLVEISNVWSNYLELHLQPTGWNAIWYILRQSCVDLKITFPKIVEIMVEKINFPTLSAEVRLIIDDDDDDVELSSLPNVITDVPLKDLYVTVFQEEPEIDAYGIAEYIDQLRLFYHHLWWPWDAESEYNIANWCSDNLENRLKMYFDKLQGNVHYITGKKIKRLMERGEELYAKVNKCSLQLLCEEELVQHVDTVLEVEECSDELESIKAELRKLELSQIRKVEDDSNRTKSRVPRTMIVIPDESVEEKNLCLQLALPLVKFDAPENRVLTKIEDALLDYYQNDTIILCCKENPLSPREHFDFPVNLIGLPDREINISDTRSHWCLFECLSADVTITNVSFKVRHSRSVITIKKGNVILDRVRMEGPSDGSVPAAILVYEGAGLLATNCDFVNFDVVIVCFGGVKMQKCSFQNNNVCLKVSHQASLISIDCDMAFTKKVPIQIEKPSFEPKYASEFAKGPIISLNSVNRVFGTDIHRCKFQDESRVAEVI